MSDSPLKIDKIGFIGAGNMASAIIRGLIEKEILSPKQIMVSDVRHDVLEQLSKELRVEAVSDNRMLVKKASWVILATKPQVLIKVMDNIKESLNDTKVLISIAAGISIDQLETQIGQTKGPVFRVMPNTPALVGEGVSAISKGTHSDDVQLKTVKQIFSAIGIAEEVPEKWMDAVTGLSGSGPAYVFTIIEALSDAGVRQGLSREIALQFAAKTVQGAAKLVLQTGLHPAKLKDQVTSPGGTTIAGLHQLEKGNLRATLMNAVEEATRRSQELRKES